MFVYRFVCVYKYCLLSQLVAVFFFLLLLFLLLLLLSFSFILLEDSVFTLSIFLLDEGNQKRIVLKNRKSFLLHFVSYLYIYNILLLLLLAAENRTKDFMCCCLFFSRNLHVFSYIFCFIILFLDSEVCVEFWFWFLNLVVGFGIGILRFEFCF